MITNEQTKADNRRTGMRSKSGSPPVILQIMIVVLLGLLAVASFVATGFELFGVESYFSRSFPSVGWVTYLLIWIMSYFTATYLTKKWPA